MRQHCSSEGTIERQAGYLMRMLEAMVADSRAEGGKDRICWRKGAAATAGGVEYDGGGVSGGACVHELFEEQVSRRRRQWRWCMKKSAELRGNWIGGPTNWRTICESRE